MRKTGCLQNRSLGRLSTLHANAPRHLQIRADTVYYLNDTGYTGIGTAPSQAAIGGRQNGVYPFKGDIAEVIFYTNSLSVAAMEATEDYLVEKYGLGEPPDPDELPHEEKCELAQVLMEGEPASLRAWALSYIGACEEVGGEALAQVLHENRDAQTQNGELDQLVVISALDLTDRAFFETALGVARDPGAGERARVDAMRILHSQINPGSIMEYEALVDYESTRVGWHQFFEGRPLEGDPLPPDARQQVRSALQEVAEDPSASPAVRSAAKKIW